MNTRHISNFWIFIILLMSITQASAQGKQKPEEIVMAYTAAHAKRDTRAVMSLVSFQSQDKTKHLSWESDFLKEFALPLKSATLAPISMVPASIIMDIKKHTRASVELVKCLVVEFSSKDKSVSTSQVYIIGVENRTYFIVGP